MNRKGFTLVELVVVMVIIAICAALTIPNFAAWMRSYHLRSAARDMVSILRTANMRAITNSREYRVYFSDDHEKYWLERGDQFATADWGAAERKDSPDYPLPTGVNIEINGTMDHFIQFNPNSTCDKGPAIIVKNTKQLYSITLSSTTGRTTVERVECGG